MDKERINVENLFLELLILFALIGFAYVFYKKEVALNSVVATLSVKDLPYYMFRSLMRMFFAYIAALVFSLIYGFAAATSKKREAIMLPILDILQSVPVLGFFPAAIFFFIAIIPNKILGVEIASIFLIFTSQVWNMAFGVYESITTIPKDLKEAYSFFDPQGRLAFFRLYFPATIPKLIYNSMVSWSNGWYFLVACEIFAVGNASYRLPGIGSFIMEAASQSKISLTLLGISTLVVVIVLLDLFIWKPLSQWSRRFRYSMSPGEEEETEVWEVVSIFWEFVGNIVRKIRKFIFKGEGIQISRIHSFFEKHIVKKTLFYLNKIVSLIILILAAILFYKIFVVIPKFFADLKATYFLISAKAIGYSFVRLLIAYLISIAWTIPTAVFLFYHQKSAKVLSPIFQVLASIPAVSLFPLILYYFIKVPHGLDITAIILILTGMQWYILFNVYGGLKAIPNDLKEVVDSMGLKGLLKFKRLLLPASLPSLMTGTITAWGGGWNALIIAEYIVLSGKTYSVIGIGSLLDSSLARGNQTLFTIALFMMVITIFLINHFVYRPLYDKISERFNMEA
ncbi:MAG: ABC transporter permease subunit [Caldisericaceae bacterium]|nr:ABC transporter permease subunit [Caldisericaceae bacterium]